jgi:hypothetical protein
VLPGNQILWADLQALADKANTKTSLASFGPFAFFGAPRVFRHDEEEGARPQLANLKHCLIGDLAINTFFTNPINQVYRLRQYPSTEPSNWDRVQNFYVVSSPANLPNVPPGAGAYVIAADAGLPQTFHDEPRTSQDNFFPPSLGLGVYYIRRNGNRWVEYQNWRREFSFNIYDFAKLFTRTSSAPVPALQNTGPWRFIYGTHFRRPADSGSLPLMTDLARSVSVILPAPSGDAWVLDPDQDWTTSPWEDRDYAPEALFEGLTYMPSAFQLEPYVPPLVSSDNLRWFSPYANRAAPVNPVAGDPTVSQAVAQNLSSILSNLEFTQDASYPALPAELPVMDLSTPAHGSVTYPSAPQWPGAEGQIRRIYVARKPVLRSSGIWQLQAAAHPLTVSIGVRKTAGSFKRFFDVIIPANKASVVVTPAKVIHTVKPVSLAYRCNESGVSVYPMFVHKTVFNRNSIMNEKQVMAEHYDHCNAMLNLLS